MNAEDRFNILRPNEGDIAADDYDATAARFRLETRQPPPSLHEVNEAARYYRPSPGLVTAINTALTVEAPLLLTGEPGTGKTQVAYYFQRYFGIPLFSYQVRSTSTVEDMKYDFDAVGYLHYAYHGDKAGGEKTRHDFLTPNALWQAFGARSQGSDPWQTQVRALGVSHSASIFLWT
jgi:MoxR-like ATPase